MTTDIRARALCYWGTWGEPRALIVREGGEYLVFRIGAVRLFETLEEAFEYGDAA